MLEALPFRRDGEGRAVGLDWPAALALAAAVGLDGDDAAELLAAGEAGLRAATLETWTDDGRH